MSNISFPALTPLQCSLSCYFYCSGTWQRRRSTLWGRIVIVVVFQTGEAYVMTGRASNVNDLYIMGYCGWSTWFVGPVRPFHILNIHLEPLPGLDLCSPVQFMSFQQDFVPQFHPSVLLQLTLWFHALACSLTRSRCFCRCFVMNSYDVDIGSIILGCVGWTLM